MFAKCRSVQLLTPRSRRRLATCGTHATELIATCRTPIPASVLLVATCRASLAAMNNPERAPARLNQEPAAVSWARGKAGLTQTQLAHETGIGRSLIAEIEAGTRNATDANLLKIAEALNCPVVFLERKRQVTA